MNKLKEGLEGHVDSFGVHFICEVEGELLTTGDDTADIHWATNNGKWLKK